MERSNSQKWTIRVQQEALSTQEYVPSRGAMGTWSCPLDKDFYELSYQQVLHQELLH